MPYRRSLFALFALAGLAAADDVQILNGPPLSGSIVSIADSQLKLQTKSGDVAVPLAQVLNIHIRAVRPIDPAYKFTDVVLTDGTVLHCKSIGFQGKDAELALLSGAVLKVPLTLVMSFLREANNQPLARKFEELAGKKANYDRIVILRDGQLNTLEGTLGEVKGKTIAFRSALNGNVVDISFDRLHGVIFFRSFQSGARPICRVNDIEGNTLSAVKLAHDGNRLTITTTTGQEMVLPQEVLANIDFNLGKLTFLSDMTPIKIVEKSGIGLVHSFRRDTNLDGEAIYLKDRSYPKGLSMHAYTDLEYNLNGKFKEFKGVLGVDARTGADSQPKVTILCDGVAVFSGTITAENIQPVSFNVKGVKTLRIIVSSKNELDLHDHVTLAEAQVSQ